MYVILSSPTCPWCDRAKALLDSKGLPYKEFNVKEHPVLADFIEANGLRTIPQVYHNGNHIGGFELLKNYMNGAL